MDAAAGDADAARNRELLMGDGQSQMNLTNLQNRVLDLHKQLEQLRMKIGGNPAGISFKAVLTDLGIVNSQFAQLHQELRPQLQFYVAHPMILTEHDCALVPEQLSSMPLLEMTEEKQELLKNLTDADQQASARDAQLRALAAIPQKHNAAINQLFAPSQTLHEKGALRKRIAANRAAIQKDVMQKLRQAAAASTPLGAGALPPDLDSKESAVLAALKKGTF